MGWMMQDRIVAGAGDVSHLQIIQTSPGAHPASYPVCTRNICQGQSGWGMILTTYFHVAQLLRMSGLYLRLPCIASWQGQGQLYLYLYKHA